MATLVSFIVFKEGGYFLLLCTSSTPTAWFTDTYVLGIDIIIYATKYMTKIKAKFFYSDQIKFNHAF